MADTKGPGPASGPATLLVVGSDSSETAPWAATLEMGGFKVRHEREASAAEATVRGGGPTVLVLGPDGASPTAALRVAARERGIPMLEIIRAGADPFGPADVGPEADDRVFSDRLAEELPARVFRLRDQAMKRRPEGASAGSRPPLADARFFALVVHDLRTPLNVIGLSLRMIGQAVPKGDPDLEEDLRFIDENFKQIERMLAQLSDYCRLFEGETSIAATPFSPRRLLSDLLESRSLKLGNKAGKIRLEVADSCPEEVVLDPQRVQTAVQYALTNAATAAGDGPVALRVRGEGDRLILEFSVDRPPPPSVKAVELKPSAFERLCGTAAERRGMDLAIVARITELFGGSARLELGDQGTTVVLDWPARLAQTHR